PLGRLRLGVEHLAFGLGADRYAAGLLLLGHDALEVDMEQPILELRALDLDVLRELETPFEGATGDPLMEIARLGAVRLAIALALDGEHAFLDLDGEVLLGEARDRERNPVVVLAGPLDVVRGIGHAVIELGERIEHVGEAIEADGGTE